MSVNKYIQYCIDLRDTNISITFLVTTSVTTNVFTIDNIKNDYLSVALEYHIILDGNPLTVM